MPEQRLQEGELSARRDRGGRRERIRAARGQLKPEKGEKHESRHQKSFANPEANMMKTGEGSLTYCYNTQAATSEDGIVVAAEVVNTPNDAPELMPMLDTVKKNTGHCPEVALADQRILERGELARVSAAPSAVSGGRGPRCEETHEVAGGEVDSS